MDIINIILLSVGSLAVLFLLTKIIGNKQMSQMNMFDYINSITIGSIAAEMAIALETDFLKPLVAMLVYGGFVFLISFLGEKSLIMRRFFDGRSIMLYDNGTFFYKNLKKARINISELLTQCRVNGFFNLAELETVIMEPDGRLSILPKSTVRPVTPTDLQLSPKPEKVVTNVILDGRILYENLKRTGNNETWLYKELEKQKIHHVKEVFLATCDSENALSVYLITKKAPQNDIFL